MGGDLLLFVICPFVLVDFSKSFICMYYFDEKLKLIKNEFTAIRRKSGGRGVGT